MTQVTGGCHCGSVRFQAEVPDGSVQALACNCSICQMTGFVHIIVPHDRFTLLNGGGQLTSYRFGTGTAEHLFCSRCGVKSFYQPRSHADFWSLNANCIDQQLNLSVEQFDGRNWENAKVHLDGNARGG
ncbi:GFA family protein [Sphingomonas sp. GCM10030256]|uniref:GFA family protein n=1 Tax=Sphingomonas sp. GCM10030256 TaxID=3273427 RepID=UPI003612D68F